MSNELVGLSAGQMRVNGVLINAPARDVSNLVKVIERRTGLPMFLDSMKEFNGKLHAKIEAPVEEVVEDSATKSFAEVAPVDEKTEFEALALKKITNGWVKMSMKERKRFKELEATYGGQIE